MSRKRTRKHAPRQTQNGAVAVEFAVIAPLFLLLLAGIIEFGLASRLQHSLSTAARHGARAASIEGSTSSQITQIVKDACFKAQGVAPKDVTVAISINGQTSGDLSQAKQRDEISVTVSIPYSKAGVSFFAKAFANSTLSSTCTLERE